MLETFFHLDLSAAPWIVLGLAFIGAIAVLGKSADMLVDQASELSLAMGIPRVIVGATIVSLGTTLPEAVVSVMAAIRGNPELALGNAVGSIICDTGLILGLACLIGPIPIDRSLIHRQGLMQFGAALLLVGLCVPWSRLSLMWSEGGVLPQWAGWMFLALLAIYIGWSIQMARRDAREGKSGEEDEAEEPTVDRSPLVRLAILMGAVFVVVLSSELLILAATELALRLDVPKAIIAGTLVAFGTSLPELTIAVTSTLRGRGDLAIGNIVGADILNVLFVAGAAAAVTPVGLLAGPEFFWVQFPAMLAVLVTFRIAVALRRGEHLPRWAGVMLIGFYLAYLAIAFSFSPPG